MSAYKWIATGLKNLRISGQGKTIPGSQTQARLPPYLVSTSVASKDSNISSISLPPKPKRPLSSFFLFSKTYRPQVVASNPNLKATEIVRAISQKWKQLAPQEKAPYEKAWVAEKEKYAKTKEAYEESLTDEQRSALQTLRLDKRIKKEKRQQKKRIKDSQKPKKPASAYIRFLKEHFPKTKSQEETLAAIRVIAEKWQALSLQDKQPYVDAYLKEREEYDVVLKKWEREMLNKGGNEDLVRNSTAQEHMIKQAKRK